MQWVLTVSGTPIVYAPLTSLHGLKLFCYDRARMLGDNPSNSRWTFANPDLMVLQGESLIYTYELHRICQLRDGVVDRQGSHPTVDGQSGSGGASGPRRDSHPEQHRNRPSYHPRSEQAVYSVETYVSRDGVDR